MSTSIERNSAAQIGLSNNGRSNFNRAKRHSRRVRLLKLGLPAAALLLVGLFAAWAWISAPGGFAIDITGSAIKDGKLVMANPKLNGFTKDNLPYAMTADRAIQDLSDTTKIVLENIDARLPIEAENWANITARDGVFDNENNTLDVLSPMTIKTSDGMVAKLASAFVDMKSGTITSSQPVSINMDGSTLHADTMVADNNGGVVVFEKRVRMTVLPDRLKDKDKNE